MANHESRPATGASKGLEANCERLQSLHVPGDPLILANAWDVGSARAVESAGFPVVATTSAGVAASLGYEDHQGAPAEEMLRAAARIVRGVEVPVTVDAEAGYGLEPAQLVEELGAIGVAGCNLEDTDHATGELRDPGGHAGWLHGVREAASEQGYGLVINARIDVFLGAFHAGKGPEAQGELVPAALRRAHAYFEAGADCVFPIALMERGALAAFVAEAGGPVNGLGAPSAPSIAEQADLGVARISHGGLLQRGAMEQFADTLESLRG